MDIEDSATPNAKKRKFSAITNPNNSRYLPPTKKQKKSTSFNLCGFEPKSQEANDIIRLVSLNSPIHTIKREIRNKTTAIDQDIQMFRSLSIALSDIAPRYEAKSELAAIQMQLEQIINEDTDTHSTTHKATPHSDSDPDIEMLQSESKSEEMEFMEPYTDKDMMFSRLINMDFDDALARQATQLFSAVNNECIEFLLDHQHPEHEIEQIEQKTDDHELKPIVHDTEEQCVPEINTDTNSNTNHNTKPPCSVTNTNTNPQETHPNIMIKKFRICFSCQVRWRLQNVEFYNQYTICSQCTNQIPVNIVQGWSCATCIHFAHELWHELKNQLQPEDTDVSKAQNAMQSIRFNNNNIDLSVLEQLNADQCLYVQIQRNNNEYYNIYRVTGVDHECILATQCNKDGQPQKKKGTHRLNLNDADVTSIIWSHCPNKGYNAIPTSQVKTICEVGDDKQIQIKTKTHPQGIKVPLERIIHTRRWLDYKLNKKRKPLGFDAESVFKHSNALHKYKSTRPIKTKTHRVRKKRKATRSVEVVETAPVNQRYFNQLRQSTTPHVAQTNVRKVRWRCSVCQFDNNSIPHNPVRCEMCLQPQETSVEMNEDEEEEKTQHILCQLRNKLNLNQKSQSQSKKGTFAGDMNVIRTAIDNSIVCIIGSSGCGKSTLLNTMCDQFPAISLDPELEWNANQAIISQFGDEVDTDSVINMMSSIGLNSVPSWLKPFHILSNGEQYRASFARLLHMGLKNKDQWLMKDEFTSCLDRANARCIAAAISKYIRKNQHSDDTHSMARFILATSKVDIIAYLQPDIVISLAGNDRYKIIRNPNDLSQKQNYAPDVKVIIDLPKFADVRKSIKSLYEGDNDTKSIRTISIDNKVSRLQSQIEMDEHTKTVGNVFDIAFEGKITTDIPYLEREHIGNQFEIGCIYGPSGSGKTTTGERLFGRIVDHVWDPNRTVCEHFASLNDMEEKFEAVSLGLMLGSSKYEHLSQGEQDRVNIAIRLGEDDVLVDEFTSNLDRATAKRLAIGVRRYISSNANKGIVILTCHADFIGELKPNWLFDIENKKVFHYAVPREDLIVLNDADVLYETKHEYIDSEEMWRKAVVRIRLKPTKWNDFDPKFSKYHYMTHHISCSALCFTAWAAFGAREDDDGSVNAQEEIVGFISVMQNPYVNNMGGDTKFHYREHRTVILPAYQGLGFGSRICDGVAYWLALNGKRLQSKTAHPRYGMYRDRSPLWIPLSTNHQTQKRHKWQNKGQRESGVKQEASAEKEKMFYSHVFRLAYQRDEEAERHLNERVIVRNIDEYDE
eukprot:274438_1